MLPDQDSATGRGLKTALQSIIGLFVVVWAVPGVPEAIVQYAKDNLVQVVLMAGVGPGVVSGVWNLLRKDVKNY